MAAIAAGVVIWSVVYRDQYKRLAKNTMCLFFAAMISFVFDLSKCNLEHELSHNEMCEIYCGLKIKKRSSSSSSRNNMPQTNVMIFFLFCKMDEIALPQL